MNQETYEALKTVMKMAYQHGHIPPDSHISPETKESKAFKQVEMWIDEVAKEYEEVECPHEVLHFPGCTCGT